MLPQPVILILSSSRRFRAENGRNHGKINELKLARRNTPRRIKRQRRTPPRGRVDGDDVDKGGGKGV